MAKVTLVILNEGWRFWSCRTLVLVAVRTWTWDLKSGYVWLGCWVFGDYCVMRGCWNICGGSVLAGYGTLDEGTYIVKRPDQAQERSLRCAETLGDYDGGGTLVTAKCCSGLGDFGTR